MSPPAARLNAGLSDVPTHMIGNTRREENRLVHQVNPSYVKEEKSKKNKSKAYPTSSLITCFVQGSVVATMCTEGYSHSCNEYCFLYHQFAGFMATRVFRIRQRQSSGLDCLRKLNFSAMYQTRPSIHRSSRLHNTPNLSSPPKTHGVSFTKYLIWKYGYKISPPIKISVYDKKVFIRVLSISVSPASHLILAYT